MHSLPAFATSLDWRWIWLIVASFLAGVLNAVAGGGSLLTFPAMLGMDILPIQANATNTVAIWTGQLTSIAGYRDDVHRNLRSASLIGAASLLGSAVGATALLHTSQTIFMHLVPWLLLGATGIFALSGPVSRRLQLLNVARRSRDGEVAPNRVLLFLAALAISFYVGYFGAGAGFLFMTLLTLVGFEDIHVINALKVVGNTVSNGIAFVIFVIHGQVVWRYCVPALLAAAAGGYASAILAHRIPRSVLRGLVVAIGLVMTVFFFWKSA